MGPGFGGACSPDLRCSPGLGGSDPAYSARLARGPLPLPHAHGPACLFTACREHQTSLKAGVAGGVLQLVGTDHAVFNTSQKMVGRHDFRLIPNGVNGLEVGGWVGSLGWAA